jgi:hypothetical protein
MRQRIHASTLLAGLLLLPTLAGAQIGNFHPVLTQIAPSVLSAPNVQYYQFEFDASHVNIYGVPLLSQDVDWNLPFSPFTWGANIGAFFNPCVFIDCTFGAGLRAGVTAEPSAYLHAKADVGSADITCPFGVLIFYPKQSDIVPGKDFTVQTQLYIDPTATMNINPPTLSAKIGGALKGKLDVNVVAEAAGQDFLNLDLFHLLGLSAPEFDVSQDIINTDNLIDDIPDVPLVVPPLGPDVLSGRFHVPRLSARGKIQDNKLVARAQDSFLTLTLDVTNALVQALAFGIPFPIEGDYGDSDFGGSFHILDLKLMGDFGIAEDIDFDPRPQITFTATNFIGQTLYTKTVYAGEDVTFTAPVGAPLTLTPTITFDQNQFSNHISLTIEPTLSFDLIHIAGHGSVAGHDLFSFDEHPFGTQTLDYPFSADLANIQFPLPALSSFTSPAATFGGFSINTPTDLLSLVQTSFQGTPVQGINLSGQIAGADFSDTVTINVQQTGGYNFSFPVTLDLNGNYSLIVPPQSYPYMHRYYPLAITATITTNTDFGSTTTTTNPITVYWLQPTLQASQFDPITLDPQFVSPTGHLTAFGSTGTFSCVLHLTNSGNPDMHSATFMYDDAPVPTQIAQIAGGYQLTGTVPGYLMDRGGTHTLSFLTGGVDAVSVVLDTFTVDNVPPVVQNVTPRINENLILAHGSGFTVDTTVAVDGQMRVISSLSSTELSIAALPADFLPGHHTLGVTTPAPGGGSVTTGYDVAVPQPNTPRLSATHSLTRRNITDDLFDMVTLKNIGPNDLSQVQITAVTMYVNGKTVTGQGLPQTLPTITRTNTFSVLATFPPHTSKPGDTAVIQVQGTVGGKFFTLSNRATLPAVQPNPNDHP